MMRLHLKRQMNQDTFVSRRRIQRIKNIFQPRSSRTSTERRPLSPTGEWAGQANWSGRSHPIAPGDRWIQPKALSPTIIDLRTIPLVQIADQLSDGVIAIDDRSQVVFANTAFERLLGYQRGETIGRSIDELFVNGWRLTNKHVDFVPPSRKSVAGSSRERNFARGKQGVSIPVGIVQRTGGDRLSPFIVAVVRDLRDEADDRARDRLAAIVNASEDAIYSTTLDGTIISWNPAAERLYGYSAAEAIRQPVEILIPPERTGEMDRIIARLIAGGRVIQFETKRVAKDGKRVWVSISVAPTLSAARVIVGVSVIARDISAIKRTEANLIRQVHDIDRRQIQTEAILDTAREAMVLILPDGSIAEANRRFYDLFGLDATDHSRVVAAPVLELSEVFRQRFGDDGLQAFVHSMTSDERLETIALHQIWPAPHDFDLSVATVRGANGVEIGRLYSFLDVTHEREVDRLKSDFVAMVSHELRTPLTAISGFVDIMVNGFAGELPTRVRHYLGVVQTNNRRLTGIIDDLLDISRIEAGLAGKTELSRAAIDLVTTINTVVTSFEPQLIGKQQSLLLDLPMRLPLVWADSSRVEQILTNLLSNAHKYTPEGGAITIATRLERDALQIEVIDTGIGITASEQERLFTKFFRSSNPRARQVSGTGLGLAITKSLVELHDGELSVISAIGQGSIFAFTLPFAPGAREVSSDAHSTREAIPYSSLQPSLARYGNDALETDLAAIDDHRLNQPTDYLVIEGFRDPTSQDAINAVTSHGEPDASLPAAPIICLKRSPAGGRDQTQTQ